MHVITIYWLFIASNYHIFRRVKSWETCVRSCSRDNARAILLSSMDQWKKFCALMRKPTRGAFRLVFCSWKSKTTRCIISVLTASNEYLNCERDHQQQVSKHCDMYMLTTFTITVFCKWLIQVIHGKWLIKNIIDRWRNIVIVPTSTCIVVRMKHS